MSTEKDSLCSRCRNPLKPRVDLSSAELMNATSSPKFEPFIQEVEAMLFLAYQDGKDYEAELIRLRSHITHIETQQVRLENHRRQLQSLISPLRKLPNETLAHIFEYTCEKNLLQDFPWHDDGSPPPTKLSSLVITYLPAMAISAVCSRWRQLALSYPSLWSNLDVEICMTLKHWSDGFISMLDRYLQVSGNSPLNLTLNIQGQPQRNEPFALVRLARHAHRWKTFKYMGEHTLTDYRILSDLRYPILTDLELEAQDEGISSTDLNRFQHAPNLRALNTYDLVPSAIPYHQLQWANFKIFSHSDMEDILRKCPSLTSLKLAGFDDSSDFPETPSTGRSIVSLDVYEAAPESLSSMVFSCFNFPLLTDLKISRDVDEDYVQTWPRKAFDSFISRSACTITTFTIRNVALSDEDVIAALRIMPSLNDFEISDKGLKSHSPITTQLISSLCCVSPESLPTGSIMHLVPKLCSLRLVFTGTVFDDKAFIKTVRSRWLPDSKYATIVGVDCLRSVVLKFRHREVDAEVYKPLLDLDKKGLRVVVSGTKRTKIQYQIYSC
ncbi:hypothetical protein BT96DRAFT_849478 [Gymnopus androsaceus JB14]|uniref:Uncharacterized protein n=1 Tax=Gymnopus androsaceus JB14 TaxID=1447944 RepID=A0A6A4ICJ8_9AGAR|nr:hypothetical protein BT96DRAFT_849478 [Gymnopus androsaceus JB14]